MGRLREAMAARVVAGDGAMGTLLLARGHPRGPGLVQLNLRLPGVIRSIHQAYRAAGAELVRTNTFLAGRPWLERGEVRAVNRAGVRLARETGALVAGSVGPLADREAYREQCGALAEEGCEAVLFETFTEAADLERAAEEAARAGMDGVRGTNCLGPAETLAFVERTAAAAAFPSAGLPPHPVTPGAFAEAAVRLALAGARLIGGCCGTTPAHIRAAARRLRP